MIRKYENPKIEIINIEFDIVATSCNNADIYACDPNECPDGQ